MITCSFCHRPTNAGYCIAGGAACLECAAKQTDIDWTKFRRFELSDDLAKIAAAYDAAAHAGDERRETR